jgi:uncharacterized membrane protein
MPGAQPGWDALARATVARRTHESAAVSPDDRCSTIASRTRGLYTQRMAGVLQSLKCCLNPKVLVGLGAVAVAVLLLAPNLVASAFPLLLALVCPLSMLAMMAGMARMGKRDGSATQAPGTANDVPVAPSLPVLPAARLAMLRASQQALAAQSAVVATEIATLDAATASNTDHVLPDDTLPGSRTLAATAGASLNSLIRGN